MTALFFIVPKKARNYLLLLASYVFYGWWNGYLPTLILFTTLVAYFAGLLIGKGRCKKLCLVLSVVIIVCTLVFFKYYNFFAKGVAMLGNLISGNSFDLTLDILLPIGISFYTFQTLSYVVDVYNNKIAPEKDAFVFALYVSFFPQLVAGPIERPENLIPQLKSPHEYNENEVIDGLKLMVVGFFEKIAIADIVGIFVNKTFEDLAAANGLTVLIATLLFAVQILCDFKGYTDIAKGVARVYGINLSDNFNKPYLARSVREFWKRWHITLSSWFRDYIYIPLGGSHVPFMRYVFNVILVFAISGLWHGAALTFLIWGVLHAVVQIIEKSVDRLHKPKNTPVNNVIRTVVTFIIVSLLWVLFRSNSLSDAGTAFVKLFTDWRLDAAYFTATAAQLDLNVMKVVAVAILLAVYFTYGRIIDVLKTDGKQHSVLRRVGKYAVYSLLIALTVASFIYLKCIDVDSSFIYFQF